MQDGGKTACYCQIGYAVADQWKIMLSAETAHMSFADSGTGKNYGYYTEMPGHGINETLSAFVPIYTIYLYKAGGENAVNSSL